MPTPRSFRPKRVFSFCDKFRVEINPVCTPFLRVLWQVDPPNQAERANNTIADHNLQPQKSGQLHQAWRAVWDYPVKHQSDSPRPFDQKINQNNGFSLLYGLFHWRSIVCENCTFGANRLDQAPATHERISEIHMNAADLKRR